MTVRRHLVAVALPTVAFLSFNLVWETLVRVLRVPAYLLPPPSGIVVAMLADAGTLARATLLTAQAALAGFLLSTLTGIASGIVLASSRAVRQSLYPFTVFLQTVPLVAIAPLLVVWLGFGIVPVAVAAFIVSVFPVIVNTVTGMRSVEPALEDLFTLYGASLPARLLKLRLPAALPAIFAGLRVAAGLAVIGAVVGEFVASYAGEDAGLGMLSLTYAREFHTDRLFAAVGLASLLGLALFGVVGLASHLALRRWHTSARPAET